MVTQNFSNVLLPPQGDHTWKYLGWLCPDVQAGTELLSHCTKQN